jgi:hypothetical protein
MTSKKSAAQAPGEQLDSLLARWDTSLTLHAKYAALDPERYWHVQPWPKHERPAGWIVALARQRVAALRRIVAQRQAEGDRTFIEALEMMTFVANLAGLQNVERFIPLATIENERREVLAAPAPNANSLKASDDTTNTRLRRADDATREMPQLPPSKVQRMLAQQRAGVPTKAIASAQAAAKRDPKRAERAPRPQSASANKTSDGLEPSERMVIDDAVRLVGWGRKWHELAELVPRLAGRPSAAETRRILRQHRSTIEQQLGASLD